MQTSPELHTLNHIEPQVTLIDSKQEVIEATPEPQRIGRGIRNALLSLPIVMGMGFLGGCAKDKPNQPTPGIQKTQSQKPSTSYRSNRVTSGPSGGISFMGNSDEDDGYGGYTYNSTTRPIVTASDLKRLDDEQKKIIEELGKELDYLQHNGLSDASAVEKLNAFMQGLERKGAMGKVFNKNKLQQCINIIESDKPFLTHLTNKYGKTLRYANGKAKPDKTNITCLNYILHPITGTKFVLFDRYYTLTINAVKELKAAINAEIRIKMAFDFDELALKQYARDVDMRIIRDSKGDPRGLIYHGKKFKGWNKDTIKFQRKCVVKKRGQVRKTGECTTKERQKGNYVITGVFDSRALEDGKFYDRSAKSETIPWEDTKRLFVASDIFRNLKKYASILDGESIAKAKKIREEQDRYFKNINPDLIKALFNTPEMRNRGRIITIKKLRLLLKQVARKFPKGTVAPNYGMLNNFTDPEYMRDLITLTRNLPFYEFKGFDEPDNTKDYKLVRFAVTQWTTQKLANILTKLRNHFHDILSNEREPQLANELRVFNKNYVTSQDILQEGRTKSKSIAVKLAIDINRVHQKYNRKRIKLLNMMEHGTDNRFGRYKTLKHKDGKKLDRTEVVALMRTMLNDMREMQMREFKRIPNIKLAGGFLKDYQEREYELIMELIETSTTVIDYASLTRSPGYQIANLWRSGKVLKNRDLQTTYEAVAPPFRSSHHCLNYKKCAPEIDLRGFGLKDGKSPTSVRATYVWQKWREVACTYGVVESFPIDDSTKRILNFGEGESWAFKYVGELEGYSYSCKSANSYIAKAGSNTSSYR